ncbi:hypothetical protein FNF29_04863 [Cafeteria roenbergensis]|uniref:Uncharacterized protein n=1 Tax=Cafeteria roenbergensis TaxID=33653 RepID=A0A5A8CCV8_CAFRO|nr:hypothetical protein FNF29_04863 [Cafeteria roenbergensis]|eukprot:KAA0150973.1 hypothetical protein FNF29_04863 [Cafeteria roenbergensis]
MAARMLPPRVDEVDGEPVIARAQLSDRWMRFRNVTMSCCPLILGPYGCAVLPITLPLYQAIGRSFRVEEEASWQLVLTRKALLLQYRLYLFGCFCVENRSKRIPLDTVDAISVVSDSCADCMSWSEGPGAPWILRIHTTAVCPQDGNTLTVDMYCVNQPEEFRFKVLEAQRSLKVGSGVAAAKVGADPPARSADSIGEQTHSMVPPATGDAASPRPSEGFSGAAKTQAPTAQEFAL